MKRYILPWLALTVTLGCESDTSAGADTADTAVSTDLADTIADGADTPDPGDAPGETSPSDSDDSADAPDQMPDDTALPTDGTDADALDSADTADSADTEASDVEVIDPEGDSDRDGVKDLDELDDGTDPFDPRSVRSLRPDIVGHPRLFTRPEQHATIAARAALTTGPAATLWGRVLSTAARPVPDHPTNAGYVTTIPPEQGRVAEAAALVGWVDDDLAMATKALTAIAQPYPDPTPLNLQSAFNAGDHYNLYESEALLGFCTAYDLAAGTPGVDPTLVASARARLVQRVDDFRRLCMTSGGCTTLLRTERNNHSLRSLAALGVCALAIPDHPRAVADFHDAFEAIHYLAHTYQGDPEGGWAESWNYLNYSGDIHLGFFAAVHRASLDRHDPGARWLIRGKSYLATESEHYDTVTDLPAPTFDPLWRNVYLNAALATQPNGLTPPVDDANPSQLHGGLLAALFDAPVFRWNWERVSLHTGRQLVSTFLMFDPEAPGTPPAPPLDLFLKDAGFSVLRSTPATVASYLYVQHEPEKMRLYGSSHEHADPLSFVLWAAGEPLAIDPGYIDYANHGKVKYGKDHNIVLVDGKGPDFFLDGLIQAPPDADAFLHDHDVAGAFTTLAASTKYQSAELRRRFVRVARAEALALERDALPDAFVVADVLISEITRRWTFQLNGLASEQIGSTSFSSQAVPSGGLATWTRPNARLVAATVAQAPSATATSRLEESALASGMHRCFTVEADMGLGAAFLTVLVPYASTAQVPTVEALRLTPTVLQVTATFAADPGERLVAWLNTGSQDYDTAQLPSPAAPGLTVLHGAGATPTIRHYTMALPPIPDPSPFLP